MSGHVCPFLVPPPGASGELVLALGQFPTDSEEKNFESALHEQDTIFFFLFKQIIY